MAWLDKLNSKFDGKRPFLISATLLAALVAGGCNVGKTDTTTTTGTSTTGTTKSGCMGSYVGGYEMPDHDERIRLRNLSLAARGVAVTGDDAVDNANAGGGPPDGGIYMAGSFQFETDGNCNVIKGQTMVFHNYPYDISGTIQKNGTFSLTWSGSGSSGDMIGKIEANNTITGKFFHPAPDNFVYGVLSGSFTPNGKI